MKMIFHWIFSILTLMAANYAAGASLTAEDPRQKLEDMIRLDMDGDASGRIGQLTFDSSSSKIAPDERELYMLDIDPLVVVAQLGRIETVFESTELNCVDAEFLVIAKTKGFGLPSWMKESGREIVPMSVPTWEKARYCVRLFEGRWRVSDPPLPRVKIQPLEAYLKSSLQMTEGNIASIVIKDERQAKNMTVVRDFLIRQLQILKKISHSK